ncbi:MAG: hypothetical protein IJK18_00675 [Clostridia bacterium]|nr:hypothetical protein [Clostridia bacterium]
MSNKLPEIYKDNLLKKIYNKIKAFFWRQKKKNDFVDENKVINKKNIFAENLKSGLDTKNTDFEKNKLMRRLTENPELLQEFSNDRLERILEFYLTENKKKREILKKLNA